MLQPFFIIVTGPPGSGKTTLAERIAKELHLPLISRDTIKERLYETLGIMDGEWDKKLGIASYEILFSICESLMKGSTSFLVESNFKPSSANDEFIKLKNLYNFLPIQIHCKANMEILYERFKQRFESQQRHPGHDDNISYEDFKTQLTNSKHEILEIGGKAFDIDTNDFQTVDIDSLVQSIRIESKFNI